MHYAALMVTFPPSAFASISENDSNISIITPYLSVSGTTANY